MKDTEEYYRLITEHTTDMISKHDAHGVFVFVSPASIRLVGYTPDELIGLNSYDFFHPDDLEDIQKSHKTIIETLTTYTVEYRFKHKKGFYLWVETTTKTIRDPKTGKVQEIISSTRDITYRKNAEAALNNRIEFERRIGEISTEFIRLGTAEIDKGINRALATIGKLSHVDRAYIFLYHDDGIRVDNTHEWCSRGIEPQIDNLKNIDIRTELPWFSACIRKHEIFSIDDISDTPPEGKAEQIHFKGQGIRSLVVVPMTFEDRLLGFIGFDAVSDKRHWTEDDKIVLRLIGELFSSAIMRKHMEGEKEKLIAELQDALKKVKSLSGLLPICSFCKKIRDDNGYWRQLEAYIRDHSEAEFSHGLCAQCAKEQYPDIKV